jgi:hypothetical protein
MKSPVPRSHPTVQLNLPLLNVGRCVLPREKQTELVLALVELLIGAATDTAVRRDDGGDDARKTHR